jgi:hypothetical protein
MRTTTLAAGALACTAVVLGAAPAMAAQASSASVAKTPACATSQLTAQLGGGDAGAGNLYRYLLLTNHSGTACVVSGFPGLSLLNSHGGEIGAPATFDHSFSYTALTVRPGQTVSDTIHTLNAGATSCQGTSTSLRIYPPANKAALVIPGKVMLCGNLLSVSPFAAGSSGNPSSSVPAAPTGDKTTAPSNSASPTPGSGGGTGSGGTGTPVATPTPASGQVGVVPSGAPDTGVPPVGGSSSDTSLIAGVGAVGAALLGAVGFMLRRRSQARG